VPTYSYECKKCGHQFEVFHAISATPRVTCEACESRSCKKLLGTGAGIIFKGNGFYETDYKKKKETQPASENKGEKKEGASSSANGNGSSADGNKSSGNNSKSTESKADPTS